MRPWSDVNGFIDPRRTAAAAAEQLKRLQEQQAAEPPAPAETRPWPKEPAPPPPRSRRIVIFLDTVTDEEVSLRAAMHGVPPGRFIGLLVEAVAREELWDVILEGKGE